jgi:hypothetical protein
VHDDNFIFVLEDQCTTCASLPYIMEDLLAIIRIRKMNLFKIARTFIKVTLCPKNVSIRST